jgi:membrane protease subunit (stomatin/prohibitin family)
MGVFDFVKNGVKEMMIARPDQLKELIVYKHPDQNFPMMSQLTVSSSECAVFFKDGNFVGILPPGRHTMHTSNIPFLTGLVNSFTGGNVFISELFFVTTVPVQDVPFGGPCGDVTDPLTGEMVALRIHGTFAVCVTDARAFVSAYLKQAAQAQDNKQILKWIVDKFLTSVSSVITSLCETEMASGKPNASVLHVVNNKLALQQAFMQSAPNLDQIGVRVTDMGEIAPSFSDEDRQRLVSANAEIAKANRGVAVARANAAAKQFEINQDVGRQQAMAQIAGGYQNYAAGQAMIGAGQGMAAHGVGSGGMIGMGAQMAVGVGIGNQMAQGFAGNMAPPQQPVNPQYAPASQQVVCAKCGAKQPGGKFCAECGTTLAQQKKFCTGCGQEQSAASKFCANCGTPSTATGPAAAPMAPPQAPPAG